MLLASVVLLKQTIGRLVGANGPQVAIVAAMPVAAIALAVLVRQATRARVPQTGGHGRKPRSGSVEVMLSMPAC